MRSIPIGPTGTTGSVRSTGPIGPTGSVRSTGSIGPTGSIGFVGRIGFPKMLRSFRLSLF